MSAFRILVKGIVQKGGKYLVVERWYDDRIVDPYQWEFLNGSMEFGETPEAAVIRVVSERVGTPVTVNKPLYTWGFSAGEICTAGIAFICDAQSDRIELSEELHDYKWISKEEIEQTISNPVVVSDIKKTGFFDDFSIGDFGDLDMFVDDVMD